MTESDRQGASGADHLGFSGARDHGPEQDGTGQMPEDNFVPAYTAPLARPESLRGGARPGTGRPADVTELQERVDNLTTRNAKLLDTLKEARQQLVALREEVDVEIDRDGWSRSWSRLSF